MVGTLVPLWVSSSLDVVRSNDAWRTACIGFSRLLKVHRPGFEPRISWFAGQLLAWPFTDWANSQLHIRANFHEDIQMKTLEDILEIIYFWLCWIQLQNDQAYCITIINLELNWLMSVVHSLYSRIRHLHSGASFRTVRKRGCIKRP